MSEPGRKKLRPRSTAVSSSQAIASEWNKMARTNLEWVAQVSFLRPGFHLANGLWPEHPGLKSETWATHLSLEVAASFSTTIKPAISVFAIDPAGPNQHLLAQYSFQSQNSFLLQ